MTDSAGPGAADPTGESLVSAVAAAVLAHPSVLRLDGGPFGSVASYLPGRRVWGVKVGDPVEIAVVVALGAPFTEIADEVARRVRRVLGDDDVAVEVTIADVGGVTAAGNARPDTP
ncbi:hypothetical protein [Pseudonocardia sp. HH130630-07]|uniref:hypothetical protein n=1 Tax=Pseudonocardia sp. HH130630-07 TaxID=1690815 RepID=UPI000814D6FF|nr:hypothetical protein [Pseudonocardia sp. HH130630-07]ANY05487.1 hypothetical protein AFB00_03280 [Pseudonocardia sp. HH130630-07]